MDGRLKVTQRLSDYEFGVELWCMREGINRNHWNYQNIEQYYQTFLGTPILCAYVDGKVGDGHNMETRMDEDGTMYYSFTDGTSERIVGTLSDDPADITIQEDGGDKWIVAKGRLFAFYAKELVDKIVLSGSMDVSAETEVMESHMDGNIEVFTKWSGIGVTILGDGVAPAIPNARITELAAMREEFNNIKLKAASLNAESIGNSTEDKPKKSKEKGVKHLLTLFNQKQVAELAEKFEGYTVLAAGQDDSGIHICLSAENGTMHTYTMESIDEAITPSKILSHNAQITFEFGEDAKIALDACDFADRIVGETASENDRLNAENRELSEKLDAAMKAIATMQAIEEKRRVQAAEDKAHATLDAFNANREEKVDAKVIESIITDVQSGVYTNSVDKDGNWTGEAEVETAVLAVCAKAEMEIQSRIASSKRNTQIWDKLGGNESRADDGSVSGLLARLGINK